MSDTDAEIRKKHLFGNELFVEPDGADFEVFDLPDAATPTEVINGVRTYTTDDGWRVVRLHYSADPDRATDGWLSAQVVGYEGGFEGRKWKREYEIDFTSWAGEPVYKHFDPDASVGPTAYDPSLPLWRGWDPGYRHPAVVWVQYDPKMPQLRLLHELYPTAERGVDGLSHPDLIEMVLAETAELFPQAGSKNAEPIEDFIDPAGLAHKETSEFSAIEQMAQRGLWPEQRQVGRKVRVSYLRDYIERGERFKINPHCVLTIEALTGGYRYPEEDKGGGRDPDQPDTSKKIQAEPYVHLMDALEYIAANRLDVGFPDTPDEFERGRRSSSRMREEAKRYLGARDYHDRTTPWPEHMHGKPGSGGKASKRKAPEQKPRSLAEVFSEMGEEEAHLPEGVNAVHEQDERSMLDIDGEPVVLDGGDDSL